MDGRTVYFMQLAVSLIASGAPHYRHKCVAEVTAELMGDSDVLDEIFMHQDGPGWDDPECPDCRGKESVH